MWTFLSQKDVYTNSILANYGTFDISNVNYIKLELEDDYSEHNGDYRFQYTLS